MTTCRCSRPASRNTRLPSAGRRRRLAGRHRRDRRSARPRTSRAASKCCTGPAPAASAAPTLTACCTPSRRRARISSARWIATSPTAPSTSRTWSPPRATHEIVLGSRYLHGVSVVNWPLSRIFLSAFANRYIRFVTACRPATAPAGSAAGAAKRSRSCRSPAWYPTAIRF